MIERRLEWSVIPWKKALLKASILKAPWRRWQTHQKKAAEWIVETPKVCRLSMPEEKGKITDAGYDDMVCIYTKISSFDDFIAEADITVNQFLYEPEPNNQEGFGLFVRETVKRHPVNGLYYSNMAAVGGYYGRNNLFGRSGIRGEDISRIDHYYLYRKVNHPGGFYEHDPLRYRVSPDQSRRYHLSFSRSGKEFSAKMTDMEGNDVLAPAENGGPIELSGLLATAEKNGRYLIDQRYSFSAQKGKSIYIGFFAARGTEILVHKDTFHLTLLKSNSLSPAGQAAAQKTQTEASLHTQGLRKNLRISEDPFPPRICDTEEYAGDIKKVWYVSPDGTASGDGSRQKPLDLCTAIGLCAPREQIVLAPGKYLFTEPVTIEKRHSGLPDGRKILTGAADGRTVLDFGGTSSMLSIPGSFWILENIHVTNGFGIQIEGSYNWLRNCSSYLNFETGFLIRHHENASARSDWPSYNLIDHCLSYENRDRAECNADGFASKIASGPGNRFRACTAFLNSDDGFDFFTKNRLTGPVIVESCRSYLNGFKRAPQNVPQNKLQKNPQNKLRNEPQNEPPKNPQNKLQNEPHNKLLESKGNGNGFKLGGSGIRVDHIVTDCVAEGNRRHGFTNNSNPYMVLTKCRAANNMRKNIYYEVFSGSRIKRRFITKDCVTRNDPDFQLEILLKKITAQYLQK